MAIADILQGIEDSGIATAVRESAMLFPLLESIHVIAIAFVFGTVVFVDLRLLGLASRNVSVTRMSNDLLPWTWGAFVLAAITGLLLLSSTAIRYYENTPLRFKFLFMAMAGINMLIFHFITYKGVKRWDNDEVPPAAARTAGGLSVLLWLLVIFFGRWIGFTI
jgi:hypothetical protein